MRQKRFVLNTTSSLLYQAATMIYGFILPALILQHFGSEVNGLVNSIRHFLGFISFLNLGVGAVVQSALYKPLANKDGNEINKIMTSAARFHKLIATVLVVYVILLMVFFPGLSHISFGHWYTASLIFVISISSFAEYYFGIIDGLFLNADQRGYIQYFSLMTAQIVNMILCIVLIKNGASIHLVKLTTSLVFLLKPIVQRIYISRHYNIDRRVKYNEEPLEQKWNGVAQHIAAVVLDGTDTIILTVFSTMFSVSIYSVYSIVISAVKQLFISLTHGIRSLLGELWAKQEIETLDSTFSWIEWSIHTATTFIFGCTASLIVPFVLVYTKGVDDANYDVPKFALLITVAYGVYCLSLPYQNMILAGNHYKQTQVYYMLAALINVVVSVGTVRAFGLVGVAIGTLTAMVFQIGWESVYISRNLIRWPLKKTLKQIVLDAIVFILSIILTGLIQRSPDNYIDWVLLAIPKAFIWFAVILIVNCIAYRSNILILGHRLLAIFNRRRM